MFGFLKKKLSEAVNKFTKKAEEEVQVVGELEVFEKPQETVNLSEREEKDIKKKEEKKVKAAKEKEKSKKSGKEIKAGVEKSESKTKSGILKESIASGNESEEKDIEKEIKDAEGEILADKPEIREEAKEAKEKTKEKEKGFFGRLFGKKPSEKEGYKEEEKEVKETAKPEEPEEKKGFFGKISDTFTKVSLSENKFEELFWELEVSLLENNVAVEVIEKIKNDLKKDLVNKSLPRNSLDKKVVESLRHSVKDLFNVEKIDLIKEAKKKKPYVIVLIGINGSGKTTTIGKLISLFQKNKLECVVGACDTFRAAAIQQLEEHCNKLGVKMIKHDYGSDPAAVAFDTVKHAEAKGKDVVLIDTAGRLHSNKNLMAELEKVIRVVKPDLKIFVGESIAGNDVVEQVKLFNEKVGIDGIILSKADIDEKGGAAISVSYVTGKPILYLGTGQGYDDLAEFSKERIIEQIGLA